MSGQGDILRYRMMIQKEFAINGSNLRYLKIIYVEN